MARICVITTGGTIAGSQQCGGGYSAATLDGQQLLAQLGQSEPGWTLMIEEIACVGSQDMDAQIWHRLAHRIQALACEPDLDGVVVTHGTDTMEETAFFLSCVLDVPFHVVLTGAMRPADAADADGPANFRHALRLAAQPALSGQVLVVMGGVVHAPQWGRKVDTSCLQAFASPGAAPLGMMLGDKVRWTPGITAPRSPHFALPGTYEAWPQVGVIWAHAGLAVEQVQACLDLGWAAWVLAGVGHGNAPRACLHVLARAAAAGVVVVRSRRSLTGHVSACGEVDDDRLGFIAAGPYDALQARILLMLALPTVRTRDALQTLFRGNG